VEELIIVGEQLYRGKLTAEAKAVMILGARCSPGEARKRIFGTALDLLGVPRQTEADSVLDKVSLLVSPKILEVPTRGINRPEVQVQKLESAIETSGKDGKHDSGLKKVSFQNGKWNWRDSRFFDTTNKLDGPIVLLIRPETRKLRYEKTDNTKGKKKGDKTEGEQVDVDAGKEYAEALVESLESLGVGFNMPNGKDKSHIVDINFSKDESLALAFDSALAKAKAHNAGFIVYVNDKKSETETFDEFKRVTEQRHGIPALCMTHEATKFAVISKLKMKSPTLAGHMANIAMNLNVKLGNINHAVRQSFEDIDGLRSKLYTTDNLLDTIILGADVVHMEKDSDAGTPSLAAVVGSVDSDFSTYLGSMRPNDENYEVSGHVPLVLKKNRIQTTALTYTVAFARDTLIANVLLASWRHCCYGC
jgi:hypothetical protein